jgi:glutamate-1-semialdehyde aminotransferase
VFFAPSGYETLFPSLAHREADIDVTLDAVAAAATEIAATA